MTNDDHGAQQTFRHRLEGYQIHCSSGLATVQWRNRNQTRIGGQKAEFPILCTRYKRSPNPRCVPKIGPRVPNPRQSQLIRPQMSQRDYYEILGVKRSASTEDIRKAFKKLARQYHPDVKPDDAAAAKKFSEITEAYDVIGDEEKRKKYDQFGHSYKNMGGSSGGNPFEGFGGGSASFDLNDILGGMFGGGGGRRTRPQKGQDIQAEIQVPFHVGIEGGEHELTLRTSGNTERLTVKIPAGIDNGAVIRLSGQGHPGHAGGMAGDVLVTIRIASHPWFRRDGRNLLIDVPITAPEAALGAKIDVPTLTEGTMVLSVPPGTSSGAKLRLRGKGVRDRKTGERGDQLVILKIVTPKDLSDRAKELYQALADAAPLVPREDLWN